MQKSKMSNYSALIDRKSGKRSRQIKSQLSVCQSFRGRGKFKTKFFFLLFFKLFIVRSRKVGQFWDEDEDDDDDVEGPTCAWPVRLDPFSCFKCRWGCSDRHWQAGNESMSGRGWVIEHMYFCECMHACNNSSFDHIIASISASLYTRYRLTEMERFFLLANLVLRGTIKNFMVSLLPK